MQEKIKRVSAELERHGQQIAELCGEVNERCVAVIVRLPGGDVDILTGLWTTTESD